MAPLSWDSCVVLRALDTAPINASIRFLEAVECRDGPRIPPLPTTLASRAHPRRLCGAAREAAERVICHRRSRRRSTTNVDPPLRLSREHR
jgi:hypothetical protein